MECGAPTSPPMTPVVKAAMDFSALLVCSLVHFLSAGRTKSKYRMNSYKKYEANRLRRFINFSSVQFIILLKTN